MKFLPRFRLPQSLPVIASLGLVVVFLAGVGHGAEPLKLEWKPGVAGDQSFWHQWPDKIYAGREHFTAREISQSPGGFVFKPYNVFAQCTYEATKLSSQPNSNKAGNGDSTQRMLFAAGFPADKLPVLSVKDQQFHMDCTMQDVSADGSEFTGTFVFAGEDVTCKVRRTEFKITQNPVPVRRDWHYGPHFRQTIDFYPPEATTGPTPLVVSIHGGGWGALDKSALQIYAPTLLHEGIAVAAINYRYCAMADADGVTPSVAAPLLDAARAIQFLRAHAAELNIDPKRIGATGGSAGGCSSLWLAFHPDLTDPKSDDPVARESTRLSCVCGSSAQTSLDPIQMAEWMPGITYGPFAFNVKGKTPEEAFAEFTTRRDEWVQKGWIAAFSPWALATKDAPPTFLEYSQPLDPAPDEKGWQTHSPRFGLHLYDRLKELGVETYFSCKGQPDEKYKGSSTAFFIDKLKGGTK